MLMLASTVDVLRVVTIGTQAIDVQASWMDYLVTGTVTTPGRTNTKISTATTTTVVAAPPASTYRNIKTVHIANTDASNPATITVQHFDNTNSVQLFKVILGAGELLLYDEVGGWSVYSADGSFKTQSPKMLFKALTADDAGGQNVATAQPWFPTAGAVTVVAATTYFFEGLLRTVRSAGAVSHTTGLLFAGTATLTNIDYYAQARTGDVNTAPGAGDVGQHIQVATNTLVKAASTATTENTLLEVSGVVRISAVGTFIPQFIYSAGPGGAPTIKRGSYFRMWPIGDNNVASAGTWA